MRYATVLHVTCFLVIVTSAHALAAENGDTQRVEKSQTSVSSAWRVGYAQADITPLPGQSLMSGYGSERYAEGALAPLRAQAVVFQDDHGNRAVLYAVDVLGFGPETVDLVRHKLQQAYGVAPQAVCLAASHTHWGPAINYHMNSALGGVNVWYLAFLEDTLVRLAGEAIRNLGPAQMSYAACETQIGMCRRRVNEKGEVEWGPNPAGSYDRHTPIVKIARQRSPKQLVIVGHACHPTGSGQVNKWSPDYPGVMRDRLESHLTDCRAMFVMGCGGDAKLVYKDPKTGKYEFSASPDKSKEAGEKLADAVVERLGQGNFVSLVGSLDVNSICGALSFAQPLPRTKILEMALDGKPRTYSTWWARQSLAYPDNRRQLDYEVQAWRLGPLMIVALEGEVCADWGGTIRAMASANPVMVIAYANRCQAYIPTARIVREGGYEGYTSHQAYFLPAPFQPNVELELKELVLQALGRKER